MEVLTVALAPYLVAVVLLVAARETGAAVRLRDLKDPIARSLLVLGLKLDLLILLARTIARYESKRAELHERRDRSPSRAAGGD